MADRFDFYFRQRVTELELDNAFAALEEADRAMIVDAGLIGVMRNAVVTENSGTPNLTVDVSGLAAIYNKLGERIAWSPDQDVDVSVDENSVSTAVASGGNTKVVSVFAAFTRTLSDPRIDGNSLTVFYNLAESFEFIVRQGAESAGTPTPPALDAEHILLADITLAFGQTAINNGDISTARREDAYVLTAPDATVLRAGTAEAAIQEVLDNLAAGGITDADVPAAGYSGARLTLSAGSAESQLQEIADALTFAGTHTFQGDEHIFSSANGTNGVVHFTGIAGGGEAHIAGPASTALVMRADGTNGLQINNNSNTAMMSLADTGMTVRDAGSIIAQFRAAGAYFLDGLFRYDSVVSPAGLSTQEDDWNPGTEFITRATANASGTLVTGIAGGNSGDFRIIVAIDLANVLTLANQNAGSTAANRIICPGNVSVNLGTPGVALLVYDGTSSRWRVLFTS